MSDLSKAEFETLRAVKEGRVDREYRRDGNVFKPLAGISPKVLWSLLRKGLIRDGNDSSGGIVITCKMALTKAGEDALHGMEWG